MHDLLLIHFRPILAMQCALDSLGQMQVKCLLNNIGNRGKGGTANSFVFVFFHSSSVFFYTSGPTGVGGGGGIGNRCLLPPCPTAMLSDLHTPQNNTHYPFTAAAWQTVWHML